MTQAYWTIPLIDLHGFPHACSLHKLLGRIIEDTAKTALRPVDVQQVRCNGRCRWGREWHFKGYRTRMICQLKPRIIHTVKLPEHLHKISLASQQMTSGNAGGRLQGGPSQMFAV